MWQYNQLTSTFYLSFTNMNITYHKFLYSLFVCETCENFTNWLMHFLIKLNYIAFISILCNLRLYKWLLPIRAIEPDWYGWGARTLVVVLKLNIQNSCSVHQLISSKISYGSNKAFLLDFSNGETFFIISVISLCEWNWPKFSGMLNKKSRTRKSRNL